MFERAAASALERGEVRKGREQNQQGTHRHRRPVDQVKRRHRAGGHQKLRQVNDVMVGLPCVTPPVSSARS